MILSDIGKKTSSFQAGIFPDFANAYPLRELDFGIIEGVESVEYGR